MSDADHQDPFVAIVGIAGRFPGASDLRAFWQGLATGTESVTRFDSGAGGATPAYGVVEDADSFDAAFFGIAPGEALMLDPQHRVFMECAWEALENAGCDPATYPGSIGVYGGSGDTGHFGTLRANRDRWPGVSDWHLRLASGADFLTSRVAYKLGLTGPAVTVQTACSTSLVAVHVAAQALLTGECDMALAGGVTVRVPAPIDELADAGVIAADGRCRAFDAAADGTVGGDGAGIVALKRLEDAIADGDHVHAVIRGSAINNDGAGKMGFAAPSVDGQAAAVRQAHLVADVDPANIGYVEAHGTGTPLGDPIEVRALTKAFAEGTEQTGFCVLGSVKPSIGHTDAAAGVIGLIKAVLALEHELIPGTVHFSSPNPQIELAASPFTVSASAVAWPRTATARLAGVNALGIGGTNAHVVLEEAPATAPHEPGSPQQLLVLSARTPAALAAAAERLAGELGSTTAPLQDVAWTLQTGRRAFAHRGFVVCGDRVDGARALAGADPGRFVTSRAGERAQPVAFLFPGQGGQHVGMAAELYAHEPAFRAELDRCAALVQPRLGIDVRRVLYPGDPADVALAADRLTPMRVSQPALFSVEYALARLWQAWGVTPEVVLGHSLGAYVAATIAGVLSLPDALDLVLERSRLLESLPAGRMLAVPLPESELQPMLGAQLSIAAINGPAQCVVTGPSADVAELAVRLDAMQVDARLLHISAAGHSILVEPVVREFEERVAGVALSAPAIPWISDRTGALVTAAQACDPGYWGAHLRHTVRFSSALQTLLATHDGVLLEVGPGRTLGTLARRHPAFVARPERPVLASLPHPSDPADSAAFALAAAGRLWQAGVELDWAALHDHRPRLRTPLPTYPFERRRFRLDVAVPADPDTGVAPVPAAIDHERADGGPAFAAPATACESAVAAAFAEVLGLREVGADDDFFELGGDSLVASRLVALLRRTRGAELEVRALFGASTVRQLAALLSERVVVAAAPGSRWLLRRTPRPTAPLRLYCFPHSGGSAGEYLSWSDGLPDTEVWGLQLPGRGGRMAQAPLTTMDDLVEAIVSEVDFASPYAFFGHSLGALVAYETAAALRDRDLPGPEQLILSAFGAPHLHRGGPRLDQLDGLELVSAIEAEYGPLPAEVHDDPELRRLVLIGLRADLEILAGYQHLPVAPLASPITVLGGSDDHLTEAELSAWDSYTAASFDLRMFSGDHFYFREQRDATLRQLAASLAECAQRALPRPGALGPVATVS